MLLMAHVPPDTKLTELKLMSEPLVPTVPCIIQLPEPPLAMIRKWAAVPVASMDESDVIAAAVETLLAAAPKLSALIGHDASSVPLFASVVFVGAAPVRIWMCAAPPASGKANRASSIAFAPSTEIFI